MLFRILFPAVALTMVVSVAIAQEPVNKPLISIPVRALANDNFNRAAIGPNWTVHRPQESRFQLVQGVLAGQTINEDEAAGSVRATLPRPCQNLGLTFKIKLGDAKTTGVGIGGKPAGDSGFVTAIWFNKSGVQINADVSRVVRSDHALEPDKWHDVMMEVVGNRVVVQINGEKVLDGQHVTISKHLKKSISFVVKEGGAAIDDIVAGEIAPGGR